MRKKTIIFLTLFTAFFFLAGPVMAQPKFSIKITGGYGTLSPGDINTAIDSMNVLFDDLFQLTGIPKEGEFEKIEYLPEMEAEIIVHFNENIGIGIGAGYLHSKKEGVSSVSYEPIFALSGTMNTEITAMPVKLSLYYFNSLTPQINVFVNGGVDYCLGKGKYTVRVDSTVEGETYWEEHDGDVDDTGIGFHGGLGLEFNVAQNFGVFIEGSGRYVNLKNWEGNETYSNSLGMTQTLSGSTWYYEAMDTNTGKYYSQLGVSEEEPSPDPGKPPFKDVRKAEINFTGISLRAGIRVKF